MKKLLVVLGIIFYVFGIAQAQTFNGIIPGFTVSSATPAGTKFTTVITNHGTTPARFAARYAYPGREHVFRTEDSLNAYINSRATSADPDEQKLQKICAVRDLVKSHLFINNMWLPTPSDSQNPDSLFASMYGSMGMFLGGYQGKCGHFQEFAVSVLVASGGFQYSDFKEVELPGHTIIEYFFKGRWMKLDFDPNQPNFWQRDMTSPNGFMSVDDIIANPAKLTDQYKWVNAQGDSVILTVQTMNEYRGKFTTANYHPIFFTGPTYQTSGTITICAGCSEKFEYVTPMLIDGSDSTRFHAMVAWLFRYFAEGRPQAYKDSANALLMAMGHSGDAFSLIISGQLELLVDGWQPRFQGSVPKKTVIVPIVQADTLFIGASGDLHDPGFITHAKIFAGTTPILDSAYTIWQADQHAFDYRNMNHLDHGYLMRGQHAEFEVSLNPIVFNQYLGMIWDTLENCSAVGLEQFINDTLVQNPVSHVEAQGYTAFPLRLYPNPADDTLWIQSSENDVLRILDVRGAVVMEYPITEGSNTIDVSRLSSGMYVVSLVKHTGTEKIVIY